jgi:hypothetical protein
MKALATAAVAAIVLTFSMVAAAAEPQPKSTAGAKPSSFAPRHTGRRVYGAPIQPPILGPQKRAHSHKATGAKSTAKTTKKKAAKPANKAAKPKPTPKPPIQEAARG